MGDRCPESGGGGDCEWAQRKHLQSPFSAPKSRAPVPPGSLWSSFDEYLRGGGLCQVCKAPRWVRKAPFDGAILPAVAQHPSPKHWAIAVGLSPPVVFPASAHPPKKKLAGNGTGFSEAAWRGFVLEGPPSPPAPTWALQAAEGNLSGRTKKRHFGTGVLEFRGIK